jgi:hypothetical protein
VMTPLLHWILGIGLSVLLLIACGVATTSVLSVFEARDPATRDKRAGGSGFSIGLAVVVLVLLIRVLWA